MGCCIHSFYSVTLFIHIKNWCQPAPFSKVKYQHIKQLIFSVFFNQGKWLIYSECCIFVFLRVSDKSIHFALQVAGNWRFTKILKFFFKPPPSSALPKENPRAMRGCKFVQPLKDGSLLLSLLLPLSFLFRLKAGNDHFTPGQQQSQRSLVIALL